MIKGRRFGIWIAVLGLLLLASLGAFALSLRSAARQFDHAMFAERQAALVLTLAREARELNPAARAHLIADYRGLVMAESATLAPGQRPAQSAELARADALDALGGVPGPRLDAMVAEISAREQQEVVTARADLHRVSRNTLLFGALLAALALVAALLGARHLSRANRDLAAEVAARTAELTAVDRSRRLFFAKTSHELRTPVTALRTTAEVALAGGGDGAHALADVVAQADYLGRRIDEMLALSSAEDGRPVLELVHCDLAGMIGTILPIAQGYARSLDVTIEAKLDSVAVAGDARWLGQAILAVIENAIKFSDSGGVVELVMDGDGVLRVTDHGPGIQPRELPRVFDAYYQTGEGRSRGGSGLGLALARWVVEQHGGTIHAEAAEGPEPRPGCRIVIGLPVSRPVGTPPPARDPGPPLRA